MADNDEILEIIEDMTEDEDTAPVAEEEPSEDTQPEQEDTQPDEAEEQPEQQDESDDMTQGMARRIKQVREEAERKAQAEIDRFKRDFAKRRGYKSVEDMDAEDFKEAVNNAGSAEELAEIRQRELERSPEVQAARKQANENYMQAQLALIHKLDPSINTLDDLAEMENFEEFDKLAHGGMTMVQAFKATAFDRLQARQAEAARQAAVNNAKSKSHLKASSAGTASKGKPIPRSVYEQYKASLPDWTDKQIREHWNKVQD